MSVNNNTYNPSTLNIQTEKNKGGFSFMEIVGMVIKHWKWFLIGVLAALTIAFLYLRQATPVYEINSSIVLKEAKSAMNAPGLGSLAGLGMMGATNNVDNEVYILKARSTVGETVERLKLYTSYIEDSPKKDKDLYNTSPIMVDMDRDKWNELEQDIKFEMQMAENGKLSVKGKVKNKTTNETFTIDKEFTQFPALLTTPYGNLSFTKRTDGKPSFKKQFVTIQSPENAVNSYRKKLKVKQISKFSSVIDLSLHSSYPQKGKDFLNELILTYNNDAIEDKNQEALNTQKFIEERISIINEDLTNAEKNVEDFKQKQRLTDIEADVKHNMESGAFYEQKLVEVETQLNIINSLNEYINDASNANNTLPSNIGVEDPTLAATTAEYNKLLLERNRMKQSMTEDNPTLRLMDDRIRGLRADIGSSINSIERGLQIQRRNVRNQANIFGGRIGSVPKQEREFLELSREQQIKQTLFLLLLEKREENALTLAATANKAKILDKALKEKDKVAPKSIIILIIALLFGLLIPAALLFLRDKLQYRIRTRSDVDRLTNIPVLVEIPTHKEGGNIAVKENETREIDEAFRMARTNLVLTLGADNKVVVFTSTISGEGKSFVTLNMAISVALLSKRVLLIGMDLRIPRLKEYLNLKTDDGLTNYLSGFEKNIDNLIVQSEIHPNLYVLPAGPIPPNPSELLSRPTLDKAISELRNEFDFIFIDSAPASQVTDTLIINRITDATVYVCRANYSSKDNIRFANELLQTGKLKNMLLVVNDVSDFQTGSGYGYGRGYGYGYGHGKNKKKSWKKRLKK